MDIAGIAARSGGTDELMVGLLLGLVLGLLAGPAFRSWLAAREWVEASREAQLADRLLARLAVDARDGSRPETSEASIGRGSAEGSEAPTWPARP